MNNKVKALLKAVIYSFLYLSCQVFAQFITSNIKSLKYLDTTIYINILISIILYLNIYYLLKRNNKDGIINSYKKVSIWEIGKLVLISMLLYVSIVILNKLLINFFPDYNLEISNLIKEKHPFFMILTIGICAPTIEEFIFRGEVYRQLRDDFSTNITIFIQAFLFSIMHPIPLQRIQTFIMGLALGIIREKTNNIWAPTIIHITSNLIACIISLIIL